MAEETKVPLSELTLAQFQKLSPLFSKDVADVFDFEKSVERRDVAGGTSKRSVLHQVQQVKTILSTL